VVARLLEHIHFEVDRAADPEEGGVHHSHSTGERPEAGVGRKVGRMAGLAAVGCILVAACMVAGPGAVDILDIVGMAVDLGRQDTGSDTVPGEVALAEEDNLHLVGPDRETLFAVQIELGATANRNRILIQSN